jgi:hypothetical protein
MMIKDRICDCLIAANSTSKFIIGGLMSFMADAGKNNLRINYVDVM